MDLLQDLRFGVRMLRRHPGVTTAAVLSLALGVGANTVIFSWAKAVLLRPLPGVARQQDIVEIISRTTAGVPHSLSHPEYTDIRDRGDAFAGVFAQSTTSITLSTEDRRLQAVRLWGMVVSANYFDAMGVEAAVGRLFLPEEGRGPGRHPVAVLGYRAWQRVFGGDPAAVGSAVRLNGQPFTIVGVTAEPFQGAAVMLDTDIYVPLMMQGAVLPGGDRLEARGTRWLQVMARLRPDVGLPEANARLGTLAAQLAREFPDATEGRTFEAVPLALSPFGPQLVLRPVLMVLSAVAGLVLLIACANVANLLLARAVGRRREIAIRLSMGASRGRLVRQLLVESGLLAGLGGAAGLVLALWGRGLLMGFAPPTDLPVRVASAVDLQLLAYTLAISVATGLVVGLVPALQASNPHLVAVLKTEAAGAGGGGSRGRLRSGLVVGQVALSLVLLAGAALFLQSLRNTQYVDPGFDPRHLLRASVDLFPNGYTEPEGIQFQRRLVERLESLAGVESATVARRVPLELGGANSIRVAVDGYAPAPDEDMQVGLNTVGPHYLRTMGIGIVAGRDIGFEDTAGSTPVALVNQTMAARYWPGQNAVGTLVRVGDTARQVVGVARTGKYQTLGEPPQPYLYLPEAQWYRSETVVHVRTTGDPAAFVPILRDQIRAMDPNLALYEVMTLETHLGFATITQRMAATLLGLSGALALLLASVGLHGVIAYAVSRRTREVGIRLALGARPGEILRAVLTDGLTMTLVGVGVGLAVTVAAMPLAAAQLYHVDPTDPATLASVSAILGLVSLLATFVPARRAARVDPVEALRHE